MSFKTKVKGWGNSMGIVIPADLVKLEKLKPNEEVVVEIRKSNVLKETFGLLKGKEINAQKLKDELRREWQ